ncbi:MAG: cytochrome c3 family protein [Gammaproteobacteria bacterium]|nr:MAG: cytochrome c3 family protein [Gammaproteobacteria bacterium]
MVPVRLSLGAIVMAGVLALPAVAVVAGDRHSLTEPVPVTRTTLDSACQECHGEKGFAVPTGKFGEGRKRSLYVDADALRHSVHSKQKCVACHRGIKQTPHKKGKRTRVNCIRCHDTLARPKKVDKVKAQVDITRTMVGLPIEVTAPKKTKLEAETGLYLASIHAQPNKKDRKRPNATCGDCHGSHNVLPLKGKAAQTYRLESPQICGRCHKKALKQYFSSVHGAAVKRYGKLDMAVCSDCHTAHKIASPEEDPVKLAITENCGSCHEKEVKTYRATYHGQVVRLGYAHTAKCADCHSAHKILPSKNPRASTHVRNRLKTCKKCHKQATAGFIKFEPHGNTHDFERFPAMWIVSKFMIVLLGGVFVFFWGHSLLWFYRELQERKAGIHALRVNHRGEPIAKKYVQRFSRHWRQVHLVLALAVMTLALTGTTLLYADSFWAPTMMKLLGGPKVAGIIHRSAAFIFGLLFFGHIAVVLSKNLLKRLEGFRWFGPDSLLPRWQDFHDFAAMMRWFFGKGPRPVFDRWTYWEKFDYWAPFWGMFVIGASGLMLWFPIFFGGFLPGWVFNVATIVHGEEAFLAIVFLFTVHFFNSHFRPEKFPLDIVMFTGTLSLEEFKEERPLEYERLVKEGKLDDYLVEPPSDKLVRSSRILGFTLIVIGLILLVLVLLGFLQGLFS